MISRGTLPLFLALAGWSGLALLLLPIINAIWISFSPGDLLVPPGSDWSLRWYREFFGDRRWMTALGNSLRVGLLSAAIALATGLPLAYALTRYHFWGRSLLGIGVLLPLAVPPVVLGVGLLPTLHALGWWGNVFSLAAAHALLGMPVVCVLARSAFESVGSDLEWAARGLGATPGQAVRRITLPLVRPALLAGALLAFVLSLNEFVLALFLATPETETLPRVLWPNLRYAVSPLAAAASGVVTLLTVVAAALAGGLWLKLRG
ncbi:MAG TPA: ABC transporter permease [Gemmataceae bacterium]|nr:ABC transporter permease [Gemmataceae bacterium]